MSATASPFSDLISTVRTLPRADRLRLAQIILSDLAHEEGASSVEAGTSYPVWTPLEAYDAAAVLLRELGKQGMGS